MQLAANWQDKPPVCLVSSLIDLEPRTTGQQGGSEQHRERLSEKTFQSGWVNKRSDSPNPERLIQAIDLWNKRIVAKVSAVRIEKGVAKREKNPNLTFDLSNGITLC